MKNMTDIFLQHPGVEAFGLSILHSLWQGALVALVLFVMLRFVRQIPNLRYILACGALLCILLVFGYTFYLSYTPVIRVTNNSISEFTTSNHIVAEIFIPKSAEIYEEKDFSWASAYATVTSWMGGHAHYIFAGWLMGFLVFSSRLCLGLYYAQQLKRSGQQPEGEWKQRLEQFRHRLGFNRSVSLLTSAQVHTPLTLGWLKPVILLPVGMLTQLPYEHLESILLHELAHIKRNDYLINLLQSTAETLLFFNPAYWYIVRIIDRERENACDDMAVGVIQQPMNYARALTKVAELSKADSLLSKTTVAANKGSLTERIRRIVVSSTGQTIQQSEKTKWYLMSIIAVAVLGAILITEEVRGNQSELLEAISATNESVISGRVVEADSGIPLPGINITVVGEEIGTVTNPSGEYALQVPGGSDTLVFAFTGYKTEHIQIDDQEEIDVELEVDVEQEINMNEETNVDLDIDVEKYLNLDLDIDENAVEVSIDSSSLYSFLYTQWEYIKKQKLAKGEKVPDNVLLSDQTLYIVDGEARDPKTIKPPFKYTISIPNTARWAAILSYDYNDPEESYAAFKKKYPGNYITVVMLTSKAVKDKPFTVTGQVFNSKTKTPIAGTKVLLKGTSTSTITDAEGNYSLRVPNGEAWLEFSNEEKGFRATARPVKMYRNRKMDVHIWYHSSNALKNLKVPEVEMHENFPNPQKNNMNLQETLNSSDTGNFIGKASAIHIQIDDLNRKDLPLYIVDGVEVAPEYVTKLEPESLRRIESINKQTSLERYGEKGKNGVVLITSKQAMQEDGVQISSFSNSENPLFIVDGKQFDDAQLSLLDPNDIATINVVKGEEARQRYGEKGTNGVVIIHTKSKKYGALKSDESNPAPSKPRPPIFTIDGIRYTYQELSNFNAGDGKFITVKSGNAEFKINLDPDDIISMNVRSGGLGITSSGKTPVDEVTITTKSGIHQYAKEPIKPSSTYNFSHDKTLHILDGVKSNHQTIRSSNVVILAVIRLEDATFYQQKLFEEYQQKYPGDYESIVVAVSRSKSSDQEHIQPENTYDQKYFRTLKNWFDYYNDPSRRDLTERVGIKNLPMPNSHDRKTSAIMSVVDVIVQNWWLVKPHEVATIQVYQRNNSKAYFYHVDTGHGLIIPGGNDKLEYLRKLYPGEYEVLLVITTKKKADNVGPSFQEAIDNATDGMLDTMRVDEIQAYNLTLDQALNRFQSSLHQYAKEKAMDLPVSTLNFSDDKVLYLLDGVKTNPKSIKYYHVQSVEVIDKDLNTSFQDMGSYGYLRVPNVAEKFEEYSKKYPGDYAAFVVATSKKKPKMARKTDYLNGKTDNLSVFPNPSENVFTIQFTLEEDAPVQATVINPTGHITATLSDRTFTKGQHELAWDATNEKPGLYRIWIIQNGETTYRNVVVK